MSISDDEYVYEDEESNYGQGTDHDDDMTTNKGSEYGMKTGGGAGSVPMTDGYIMKSYDDIAPYMTALLTEMSSIFGLDIDQAQILLQHKKWNRDRFMDWFVSDGDDKRMFLTNLEGTSAATSCLPPTCSTGDNKWGAKSQSSEKPKDGAKDLAKVSSRGALLPSGNVSSPRKTPLPGAFECPVCYDTESESFCLGCEHRFCYDCYSQYVTSQVHEGPACIYMKCPQHKCSKLIPRSVVARLAQGDAYSKYSTYVTQNFIESNKSYRYCPAANCSQVAIGSGVTNVKCPCGNKFCFRCGDDAHEPCSCAHLEAWNLKCRNESETANWIIVNTKKCPSCASRIEKNQGCNHMKCGKCSFDFCWICMGPWTDHNQDTGGYYKCNRFETGKAVKGAGDGHEEQAKAELERYLHFYKRFHGHDHALGYAHKSRVEFEKKIMETKDSITCNWLDTQFLTAAADLVIECRRLLKYTYVLGYFLQDGTPEKALFEHQQEMLEKDTERLQEATEQPKMELIDRARVINLTRVTERFMHALQASMSGGEVQSSSPSLVGSGKGTP